jgi:hypothetical protein
MGFWQLLCAVAAESPEGKNPTKRKTMATKAKSTKKARGKKLTSRKKLAEQKPLLNPQPLPPGRA